MSYSCAVFCFILQCCVLFSGSGVVFHFQALMLCSISYLNAVFYFILLCCVMFHTLVLFHFLLCFIFRLYNAGFHSQALLRGFIFRLCSAGFHSQALMLCSISYSSAALCFIPQCCFNFRLSCCVSFSGSIVLGFIFRL